MPKINKTRYMITYHLLVTRPSKPNKRQKYCPNQEHKSKPSKTNQKKTCKTSKTNQNKQNQPTKTTTPWKTKKTSKPKPFLLQISEAMRPRPQPVAWSAWPEAMRRRKSGSDQWVNEAIFTNSINSKKLFFFCSFVVLLKHLF